jgi:nucleoside-diphosphate-sugar epimerase
MPVMVVGADTGAGRSIVERLLEPGREVRAFVTDPAHAEELRRSGVKVALGDVSDESHVSGACLNCFSVVFVDEAATDGRLRSFASDPEQVRRGWAEAATSAGVTRVIWVTASSPPPVRGAEFAAVDPGGEELAEEIFQLDAVRTLG